MAGPEFTSFAGGSAHPKAVSCYLPAGMSRAGQQEGMGFQSKAAQDVPRSCLPALITLRLHGCCGSPSPLPGGEITSSRRRLLRAGFSRITHCHSLPRRHPWHLPQQGLPSTNWGINAGKWEFHRRCPLGTSPANLHLDGCLSLSTLLIKARSPPMRQRSY